MRNGGVKRHSPEQNNNSKLAVENVSNSVEDSAIVIELID